MKNFKLIYIFSILGLFLTSCDPSVESPGESDASFVTYLPLITLEGGDVTLDCDASTYTDPGAVASAGGNEIELFTSVNGIYFGGNTVDGPDTYSITYSAFNDDEIPAAGFRTVIWPACNGDLVNSIAGMYTASILRTATSGATVNYTTRAFGPYFIIDLGGGVYQLSDAIGGFYEYGYGYGPDYAATGLTVTANNIATNDFTHDDVIGVGAFGGSLNMTDFSVNPVTKTIEFATDWSFGYVFEVTLTQVQ
ncbi:BT_2262 family domain-containing protein [Confluentibacter flavum]|uniref:BT-2262-like C-terminal domain-containing protein n=1 Tax=Confluentibacter flavum TaxID=1909700 RepID=A0A2N3HKM5_9FLAO|nr:BT_2262 family domain-containing protein [Confluentibacter flavum]PKQ45442.1 hypothetical protein CSW08_08235 [Confluentibacter flavum]